MRSAPTCSLAPLDSVLLGPARRQLARPARGRGPCGSLPGGHGPGSEKEGPLFFSPFLPQLAAGLLCLPFAAGRVLRLAALSAASSPPGLSPFAQFLSISFRLSSAPFQATESWGKVASPSLSKSSESLSGCRWVLGVCESVIDPESPSGLAPAFPRRCLAERCSQRWPDRRRRAAGWADAAVAP